jgi:hypothetical protein
MSVTTSKAWQFTQDATTDFVVPTIRKWIDGDINGSASVPCPFRSFTVTQGGRGTDRMLDMQGKIDAQATVGGGIAGVSIRCQRDRDYRTFTLRTRRDRPSGPWNYIELDALSRVDTLHAQYIVQAYIDLASRRMLALYLCTTADLVQAVRDECAERNLSSPLVTANISGDNTGFHQINHKRVPGSVRIAGDPLSLSVNAHEQTLW